MRQLGRRVHCVDVYKVYKYLVTSAEHQSESMSLIIVLGYIFLRLLSSRPCFFQYELHMIGKL